MEHTLFEVEPFQPFAESLLWQLNRDYYQEIGIEAWSDGLVPHQLTSNSMVGKTYAELILGLLKDLAAQGATKEKVYILELGAGHGRLAFHILKHLEKSTALMDTKLPPFCYVISDIVDENLLFFKNHPQLQEYYEKGVLDYAYYDAIGGTELKLNYADLTIKTGDLKQPIVSIANYFFDSIPNDLFHIQEEKTSVCSVALHSKIDPKVMETELLLKSLELSYEQELVKEQYYKSPIINEILNDYKSELKDTYLFFPEKSMICLNNLKALSTKGMMLLSMDKGYHDLKDIDNKGKPEIITHGSFSLWVNFQALSSYCKKLGGEVFFPTYSTFHLQLGCLLFLEDASKFQNTSAAYQRFVNDFGPDDYNSIKLLTYDNIADLSLMNLIALLRLSAYDSSLFLQILPRLKQVLKEVSHEERGRIAQTIQQVWRFYFDINEPKDLAISLAGIFFDLGYYEQALEYFEHSSDTKGMEADTCYNKILCYYQLRQDVLFEKELAKAKLLFPDSDLFEQLNNLDLNAV